MIRRYSPLKPSRGTTWPTETREAILARDRGCIGPRLGFPGPCFGAIEIDHVRASHGMGMKSDSVEGNGVSLCSSHHRLRTENGRVYRPLLIAYLAAYLEGRPVVR